MSVASPTPTLDVYAYDDFRALLRDYYNAQKARGRGFSYRSFAAKAGLTAPNHLKLVIDGDRNLSQETAARFAQAMGLKADETRYFCDLVAFNQASSHGDSVAAFKRLTRHVRYRRAHKLTDSEQRLHASWYIPVIRELVEAPGFDDDPSWIASHIMPSITTAEAQKAIDFLLELGLLVREGGKLKQATPVITTGTKVHRFYLSQFHRAMLERAWESIDRYTSEERDVTSVTIRIAEKDLPRLKDLTATFRKELLALESESGTRDRIYQVGVQAFPVGYSGKKK